MSIQNEINRIKSGVSSAYDTIAEMGGAVPAGQSIDSLSSAISSIPRSSPNLLENWYFLDPINQRGQTEYTTALQYTIDRWLLYGNGFVQLNTGEALVLSGRINNPLESQQIPAGMYTYSALIDSVEEGTSVLIVLQENDVDYTTPIIISSTAPGLIFGSAFVPFKKNGYQAILIVENGSAAIRAVKLELGTTQTLAHKEGDIWVLNDPPPNKALELVKCQRYYEHVEYLIRRFANPADASKNLLEMGVNIEFLVEKRIAPTVQFEYNISDGETQTAFANTVDRYGFSDNSVIVPAGGFIDIHWYSADADL